MSNHLHAVIAGFVLSICVVLACGPAAASEPIVMAQAETAHSGTGKINTIDLQKGKANITHEPIKSLGWPAMTMDFQVRDKEGLAKLKPGDPVEFEVTVPARGQYVITEIKPK